MSTNLELDVVAHVGGGGLSFRTKARGLSQNGLFLVIPSQLKMPGSGARVQIVVDPHDGERPLVAAGQFSGDSAPGVAGVSFKSLSATSRARIKAILSAPLAKAG